MAAPAWFVTHLLALQRATGQPRPTSVNQLHDWAKKVGDSAAPSRATIARWLRGSALPSSFESLESVVVAVGERAAKAGKIPPDPPWLFRVSAWRRLYEQACEEVGRGDTAATQRPPVVYQGLAAFGRADASRFYGRQSDVAALLTRIESIDRSGAGGPLIVLAPSGVGKSSLLAAGLIPEIEKRGLPSDPAAANCAAVVITPGQEPLTALTTALPPLRPVVAAERLDADAVREAIANSAASSAAPDADPPRLLLVVDQFEEILQGEDTARRRFARARFVDILAAAATPADNAPAPAIVVIAARDDFYHELRQIAALKQALNTPYNVDAMNAAQLTEAIREPARAAGINIAPDLIPRLLTDAGVTSGGTIEGKLPLISHVLRVMNAAGPMTVRAYEEAKGIDGAVAHTANEAWARLRSDGLDSVALTMLVQLVNVGQAGGHDTRRQRGHEALIAAVGRDDPQACERANRALGILSDARLVTLSGDTVSITHEALLRAWQQLRDAIDGERADLSLGQEIERRARQWDDARRPPDRLYRGTELLAARRVAEKHRLEDQAQEFLAAADEQERRELRRRRLLTAISATAAGVILASAAGLFILWREGQQREQDAVFENAVAQADRMHGSDLSLEALLDVAAYRMRPTPYLYTKLVETEGEALSSVLRGHALAVNAVAWSPDGTVVASASADHTLRLWSATDPGHRQLGAALALHRTDVDSVAWSPNGRVLASGGDDGTIYLWDVADPNHVAALGTPLTLSGGVNSVAFSPDGRTLAAVTRATGMVYLYNIADPAHPTPLGPALSAHSANSEGSIDANSVTFNSTGRVLASADDDGTTQLWNVTDPAHSTPLGSPIVEPGGVNSVSFSPDGRTLATACADHTLRLYGVTDPAHPSLLGLQTAGSGPVLGVAYSPDGHTVATSGDDHKVRLWDVADPSRPGPEGPDLVGHTGPVWKVAWSPDGRTLASGSEDSNVRLWAVPTIVSGHTSAVNVVVFSQHLVVSGGDDHTVRLWNADPNNPTPIGGPVSVGGAVTAVALSGDGQLLVVASDDDNIRLYNVADPAHPVPVGSPIPSTETVTTLALSPDGRALATSGDGSITRLYDLAAARSTASTTGIRSIAFSPSGHDLRTPPGHSPGNVAAVAWSPDGHTLAAAADDDGIRLFNVTDLTHPTPVGHPLLGHIRSIRALSFTLDGRTLASAGDDDSVRLWDTSDLSNAHELGQPLSESTSSVNAVAWSPNGGILASGGNDNSVRLWDTTDRHNPSVLGAPLTAHTDAVRAVAFNPTGTVLASAARDGTMRLWNLDADEAIHRICIRTANTVGPDEWSRLFPNVPFDQPCTDD
ncbi:MAG: hypothetical protein QOF84_3350 [Streptomyces sp.]|nr:hypothetical protein [Streptomyces sp.]